MACVLAGREIQRFGPVGQLRKPVLPAEHTMSDVSAPPRTSTEIVYLILDPARIVLILSNQDLSLPARRG